MFNCDAYEIRKALMASYRQSCRDNFVQIIAKSLDVSLPAPMHIIQRSTSSYATPISIL